MTMHPGDFVTGKRYRLLGRGDTVYTYQTQTSIYQPGSPVRSLVMVFESVPEDAFPTDLCVRYVPARAVEAEEVL